MLEENFDELTAFVESTVNLTKSADSNLIGLRTFEFKYFRNRSDALKDIQLYDLQNDPLEENNIYLKHPEIIKKFESELIKIDKNKKFLMTQFTNEIDSQEAQNIEKKLKDAGYIN